MDSVAPVPAPGISKSLSQDLLEDPHCTREAAKSSNDPLDSSATHTSPHQRKKYRPDAKSARRATVRAPCRPACLGFWTSSLAFRGSTEPNQNQPGARS